ncbi:hypothetical protein B0H13DRAFT_1852323 [Mycena leptocephala]|nr:hypothetical protein B0H13DRAFT_1852323 [Mycena leptocephala]
MKHLSASTTLSLGRPSIASVCVKVVDGEVVGCDVLTQMLSNIGSEEENTRASVALKASTSARKPRLSPASRFCDPSRYTNDPLKCLQTQSELSPEAIPEIQHFPFSTIARKFYYVLAMYWSHSSLRELAAGGDGDHDGSLGALNEEEAISSAPCSPSMVSSVWLCHPVGFDLDDATVRDMVRAWPNIRSLSLSAGPSGHVPSRVTLSGLYAFVPLCSRLRDLDITFDATVVPKIKINGKKRQVQRTLESLDVGASPITKPSHVARSNQLIMHRWVNRIVSAFEYKDLDNPPRHKYCDGVIAIPGFESLASFISVGSELMFLRNCRRRSEVRKSGRSAGAYAGRGHPVEDVNQHETSVDGGRTPGII